MKACTWNGINDVRVETVPDPAILAPHDIILRVGLSAVCGSDLHLIDGFVPTMKPGDILGHEFMGEVVDVGPEVQTLRPGDRAVVMPCIACGGCWFCENGLWSMCDNSNPHPHTAEALYGHASAGVFGYSHAYGGFAGSHAEYVRVPFADRGAFKVPEGIADEQALFVSDALPTGYMAAEMCNIRAGDIVAVWGCGGVGLMAIQCAYAMGAERVIAIDRVPERLALARDRACAIPLNFEECDVVEELLAATGGRGPDACIDAVGMEADATGPIQWVDKAKQATRLESDRPYVLRETIRACRKGGTVVVIGAYGGAVDKFPIGAVMNKGLTVKSGMQHGHRYAKHLFQLIARGDIDPSYLLTHPMKLSAAPEAYRMFKDKTAGMVRAAFRPH